VSRKVVKLVRKLDLEKMSDSWNSEERSTSRHSASPAKTSELI
jgi:hypothetical protein